MFDTARAPVSVCVFVLMRDTTTNTSSTKRQQHHGNNNNNNNNRNFIAGALTSWDADITITTLKSATKLRFQNTFNLFKQFLRQSVRQGRRANHYKLSTNLAINCHSQLHRVNTDYNSKLANVLGSGKTRRAHSYQQN